MKAMILAAGFGSRLAPYTDHTPKPLFTMGGRPLLDIIIGQVQAAGCKEVIINTHHLHRRIQAFLNERNYATPLVTRHEESILGTGGGIRNIAGLWENDPLLIINSDIVTDIDLEAVAAFHRGHGQPVTLVMHDYPQFNTVWVDSDGDVVSFDGSADADGKCTRMAFTGIHVVERAVLDYLPPRGFADIIDAYRRMLVDGRRIRAYLPRNHYWRDIGTPSSYQDAVFEHLAPIAFEKGHGLIPAARDIERRPLAGDGSDRSWTRLQACGKSLVMADHGIRVDLLRQEADAFVAIGRHLRAAGVPVPEIYAHESFAGLVFMEDLGDEHLQQRVGGLAPAERRLFYGQVIDEWIKMAVEGKQDFDPAWTYQSTHYDRDLILEKECRYFTEAFLQGYLNLPVAYETLQAEFEQLARGIEQTAIPGLIHRDFQSRNIMLKDGGVRFIDFQGARLGPLQYDLASLLIDPYADLDPAEQDDLLQEAARRLEHRYGCDSRRFIAGFRHCAVSRNLQILGAFAFLSRVKGKKGFEAYIPRAAAALENNLARLPLHLPGLDAAVDSVKHALNPSGTKEGER